MSGAMADHGIKHLDAGNPYKNVLVVHQNKDLFHFYNAAIALQKSDLR